VYDGNIKSEAARIQKEVNSVDTPNVHSRGGRTLHKLGNR
jgi:hypothetical protein